MMDTGPDGQGRAMQIIPSSAISACPTRNMSPRHYSHYHLDAKCNHGRLCGYSDENGGPCTLSVEDHPQRGGKWVHDDGTRWAKGDWRR